MILRKNNRLTIFFYLLASSVYYVSTSIWGMTNNIRYAGLLLAIFEGFLTLLIRHINVGFKELRGKNLFWIFILSAYLILASIVTVHHNEVLMSSRVWIQTSYLLIPALYAFVLVNLLSHEVLLDLMKYTFLLVLVLYIHEIGIANFFSLSNWTSISFSQSDSSFESSDFSGIFTTSLFYFFWSRYILKEEKHTKFFFWLSLIFAVLSWKRLSVVFVIFLWIFGKWSDINKEISKIIPIVTGLIFGPITMVYTLFVKGEFNPFNLNISEFTKGRNYILSLWANSGYLSYGYGSSYLIVHRYLEMDLVQMYLEVGILAVSLFGLCYFNLTKKSLFAYMIMLYEFLNMLTASSLPSVFEWALILTLIIKSSGERNAYLDGSKGD